MEESEQGKIHTSVPLYFQLNWQKEAIKGEAFSKIHVYFNLRSKLNNSMFCVCSAGIPRESIQSVPFKGRNPTSGQVEVCVHTMSHQNYGSEDRESSAIILCFASVLNLNTAHTIDSSVCPMPQYYSNVLQ